MADGVRRALRYAPRQLFLLSDTLGGDGSGDDDDDVSRRSLRRSLMDLNGDGVTRIHVIHFFHRAARQDLIALAREHRGSYSFVPAAQP